MNLIINLITCLLFPVNSTHRIKLLHLLLLMVLIESMFELVMVQYGIFSIEGNSLMNMKDFHEGCF